MAAGICATLDIAVLYERRDHGLSSPIKHMGNSRIPAPLKRWRAPVWNVAHYHTGIAFDYLNSAARGRFAFCAVCGRYRVMLYRRRIILRRLVETWGLSPRLADALAQKRVALLLTLCGAKLRARRMAMALVALFPVGSPPAPVRRFPNGSRLLIAVPCYASPRLTASTAYTSNCSSCPASPVPTFIRVPCPAGLLMGFCSEDLAQLTYSDASFDLVLTSETLEHVPDLETALREIHRVLVPGGCHIFTIPQLPHVPTTFARAVVLADGSIEDRAPAHLSSWR